MLRGRASVFWGGGLHHFAAGVCAALGVTGPLPLCGMGLRRVGDTGASAALGQGSPPLWGNLGLRCFGERASSAFATFGPPPLSGRGRVLLLGSRGVRRFVAGASTALATPGPWGHRCLCYFGNTEASATLGQGPPPLWGN